MRSIKIDVLKNFAIFTGQGLQLYYKETPSLLPSHEYFKILKNTYFEEHLWTAAFNCLNDF